ncbi:MAG TPA: transcriptional repressor [Flavobacteriales bacterium]|nr:transcriptional repressor [Flavobacteriales bacterium]HRE96594.1 transcriptional repressor [Flavobacteriales bacterium]HRJ36674.1 transcriptional repressor [Flavobacteriales bacterium]HRJ38831.1 transcriptional repressor [Flavobacteriales bacterium]
MKKAADILIDKDLRKTPCRVFVLGEFIRKGNKGISETELENRSKGKFDRVTIYRTLKTFMDADILHKVIDDDNLVKYALCKECEDDHHSHEHVHFKCTSCNTTSCLDEISIVSVDLPKGYKKIEANYLIIGTCPECK